MIAPIPPFKDILVICSLIYGNIIVALKLNWVLKLLKNEKKTKVDVRGKRFKAGWDNNYLIKPIKN
jgi:hypothetical protein